MKSRRVLAGVLALLALGATAPTATRTATASPPQEASAEVAAALRGLERAFTRHSSYTANGFFRRLEAKGFGGCRVTYDLIPQVPPGHTGYAPYAERMTIDLASLDIDRVQVRPSRRGASVSFAALSGVTGIERRLGRGLDSFGEAAPVSAAYLYVPSKVAAEEVRAALVRAVESCAK